MTETFSKNRLFKQVDVFTSKPCQGNPVAVILDGEGLTAEQMQRLAAWTHLSETVFLFPSSEADYELRIFCPQKELPFAGHPTIGAAHAALEAGLVRHDKLFHQKCKAGIFELWFADQIIWVRTPVPQLLGKQPAAEELQKVLTNCVPLEPMIFNAGPIWTVARVATVDELNRAWFKGPEIIDFSNHHQTEGIILYAFLPEGGIEVRAFAPAVGVDEDPVCGSGNLAAAAHLRITNGLARTGTTYMARQGRQLGRDGRLYLSVKESGIELGGQAVTVFDGKAIL